MRFNIGKKGGLSAVLASVVLVGCTSMQRNDTAELMEPDEFRSRIDSIEPGDCHGPMLSKLQMTGKEFDNSTSQQDPEQAYKYIYGDNEVSTGSRIEEYQRLRGFFFPYIRIEETERPGLMHTKVKTRGYNLSTIIIQRDGCVVNNPVVSETPVNKDSRDAYLKVPNPMKAFGF